VSHEEHRHLLRVPETLSDSVQFIWLHSRTHEWQSDQRLYESFPVQSHILFTKYAVGRSGHLKRPELH